MKAFWILWLAATLSHAEVLRNVAYVPGGEARQQLDIHLPEKKVEGGSPVWIAIHGGAWAFGDKANRGFVQPKMSWLQQQGHLVVSINYRLSPAVTHPGHIDDVCTAIAWVQNHITRHGGDPTRLHLLGHSAGAHLAALAAVDEARLKQAGVRPANLRGVILLDGAAYDVPTQIADSRLPKIRQLYLRAFTPDAEVQRDASPTLKVAGSKRVPPPFLILHVANRENSKAQSEKLAAALRAQGGTAEVVAIEDKTHSDINRDLGKPGDATTQVVAAFLKKIG